MNFNKHSNLEGTHAFLGASKYGWLNYDENRVAEAYLNAMAKERGTELHAFAAQCIKLRQKLPRSKKTLNMYVNDAIGFRMKPEQILYYSDICYGTADTISFEDFFLRIHDYKSGITPAHMEQLLIYEALFCLEYHFDPEEIKSELRIYQHDEIYPYIPTPDEIRPIMNKIVAFDKIITKIKKEEG